MKRDTRAWVLLRLHLHLLFLLLDGPLRKIREYSLSSLSDNGEANVPCLRTKGGAREHIEALLSSC